MKKDSWDEGTFQMEGKKVYNYISEERIREIVREEIVEYNKVFMSKIAPEQQLRRTDGFQQDVRSRGT